MIAGMVVGAAGLLLTVIMAKAMNRSIANVLFTNFGAVVPRPNPAPSRAAERPTDAADAAIKMRYATSVIIVPGYGLAAAHAQQKLFEFVKMLLERGGFHGPLRNPSGGRPDAGPDGRAAGRGGRAL